MVTTICRLFCSKWCVLYYYYYIYKNCCCKERESVFQFVFIPYNSGDIYCERKHTHRIRRAIAIAIAYSRGSQSVQLALLLLPHSHGKILHNIYIVLCIVCVRRTYYVDIRNERDGKTELGSILKARQKMRTNTLVTKMKNKTGVVRIYQIIMIMIMQTASKQKTTYPKKSKLNQSNHE